eukprot:Gb_38902 [translate_table: standard]
MAPLLRGEHSSSSHQGIEDHSPSKWPGMRNREHSTFIKKLDFIPELNIDPAKLASSLKIMNENTLIGRFSGRLLYGQFRDQRGERERERLLSKEDPSLWSGAVFTSTIGTSASIPGRKSLQSQPLASIWGKEPDSVTPRALDHTDTITQENLQESEPFSPPGVLAEPVIGVLTRGRGRPNLTEKRTKQTQEEIKEGSQKVLEDFNLSRTKEKKKKNQK